jgi:hypothetical protein
MHYMQKIDKPNKRLKYNRQPLLFPHPQDLLPPNSSPSPS